MKKFVIEAVAAVALLAGPVAAEGQNCAPHERVVERLASAYGETRQSIGLGSNNVVVEVFASETSGSWTITATNVTGRTCLVASGQAYEAMVEALPAQGNDT